MTLHPLSAGDGYRYLTRSVACGDQQRGLDGLSDYYVLSGLPPGRWFGSGCEGLGLAGTVAEADVRALFGAGVHPGTGERLGRPFPTFAEGTARSAVAGYDLTFSPVKSVSVLWGLTEDASVRREVHAAHRAAVEETLGWLEQEAALTRTGPGGVAQVDTRGLTVACFDHWESRCGDPDLHTHAVVSAKVQTVDGAWRALDSQALHHIAVAASEMYNTRLEGQLAERLGVEFTERPGTGRDGKEQVRELAGVDDRLIDGFSTRRHQVEKHLAVLVADYRQAYGRDPDPGTLQRLAGAAVTTDRPAKGTEPRRFDQLHEGWAQGAVGMAGPQAAHVDSTVAMQGRGRGRGRPAGRVDVGGVAAGVLARVEGRRATFGRWHVHAEAERAVRRLGVPVGEQPAAVQAVVGEVLGPLTLQLTAPEPAVAPGRLRRRDGQSVYVRHAAERYTTGRTLDAERRLVAAAKSAVDVAVGPGLVEAVLSTTSCSPEQADAVRRLAGEDRAVDLLVGPAGTGKTTTLAALVAVWQADGRPVLGLAPSAAAAAVLAAETGVATENVAKWLHESEGAGAGTQAWTVRPGSLVLVDEASMAGTHALDRLRGQAQQAGAKLVLVGDPRQLGAVGAGGVLRLLEAEVGAARLSEAWRFRQPWERDAAAKVRVGDPSVVDVYTGHGRVAGGSDAEMAQAAFAGWQADIAAGRSAVLVTGAGVDVAALSARARAARVEAGQVEADGVPLRTGGRAGVGDQVVTRVNARTLTVNAGRDFVKNGDVWTVQERHRDGALRVVHAGHGGTATLPGKYVAASVELAYAATVHRAQGMTVDAGHLLLTGDMSREAAYVGLTRGRHDNRAYVVTHRADVDGEHKLAAARTAAEVFAGVLTRDGAQRSATETLRDVFAAAESLATLRPRYDHAADLAARDRHQAAAQAALGLERAAAVVADPAWPALSAALHAREAAGQPAADVLTRIVAARELDTAGSVAQVLAHRLDREPLPGAGPPLPASELSPPGPMRDYLADIEDAMTQRTRALAGKAEASPPPWRSAVGRPPDDPVRRGRWLDVTAAVAAYRETYSVTDPTALGPEVPGGGVRAVERQAAAQLLDDWQPERRAEQTARLRAAAARSAAAAANRPFGTLADAQRAAQRAAEQHPTYGRGDYYNPRPDHDRGRGR